MSEDDHTMQPNTAELFRSFDLALEELKQTINTINPERDEKDNEDLQTRGGSRHDQER